MVGGTDWVFVGVGLGALVLLSDVGDTFHDGGVSGLWNGVGDDNGSTSQDSNGDGWSIFSPAWDWPPFSYIGDGEGWL